MITSVHKFKSCTDRSITAGVDLCESCDYGVRALLIATRMQGVSFRINLRL